MPYIPPDAVFDPGVVLGDAKTIETRGVYIRVDANGFPLDPGLKPGVACWIDNSEGVPYAKPYPTYDPATASLPNPFGIVLHVYARDRDRPYQLNQNENTVVVAVSGTVGLKFEADPYTETLMPRLGDRVSPYGTRIGSGTLGWPSIGICDGKSITRVNGKDVIVIAVRLDVQGEAEVSSPFGQPFIATCKAEEEIKQYDWVYASNIQPTADERGAPTLVKAYKEGGHNKHIYGLALEPATSGAEFKVLYYGIGYVPYVLWTTAKLAGLDTANGGKMPTTFENRIVHNDGSVGTVLTTVLTVGSLIGTAVEVGGNIYRMIKGGSSPAKCFDNVPRGSARFQQLLAAEDGVFNVAIDGYQGLFVNPGLMGPATLTEAPVLLDEPERDKNGNILIREGRIYAGALDGVKAVTRENVDGVSFYGVSAPTNTDDTEVNPLIPPNDTTPRLRAIREGIANVEAVGNWVQGAYINLLGEQIPAEDEEFVPHIGKALEATTAGNLGPVDIQPFNPNQYIIVEHCKMTVPDEIPLHASVYVELVPDGDVDYAKSNIGFAGETAEHLYTGVTGVLVRYDADAYPDGGEYSGRAVIQISGYVKCILDPTPPFTAGMLIQYMVPVPGGENGLAVPLDYDDPTDAGYVNILGTLLRTDAADGSAHWFVALAPRTQYVAPLESSKKV